MEKELPINTEIEVKIITSDRSSPYSLNNGWEEENQIITFLYKGELYVAIDNLQGIKAKFDNSKGGNYKRNETIKVIIKRSSNFFWIKDIRAK